MTSTPHSTSIQYIKKCNIRGVNIQQHRIWRRLWASSSCSYFVLTRDYLHCFKRASGSANERISDMGQFIFKVSDIVSGGVCVCARDFARKRQAARIECVCQRWSIVLYAFSTSSCECAALVGVFICVRFQVKRKPKKMEYSSLGDESNEYVQKCVLQSDERAKETKKKKQHDALIILYLALLRFSPIFRIGKNNARRPNPHRAVGKRKKILRCVCCMNPEPRIGQTFAWKSNKTEGISLVSDFFPVSFSVARLRISSFIFVLSATVTTVITGVRRVCVCACVCV